MDREELKRRMSEVLDQHYFKDENGLFYDEVYVDYRDELGDDNAREILGAKAPMEVFDQKMDEWYSEACDQSESNAIDKLIEADPALAAVYDENEDLFRDTLFDIFYVKLPHDHFLDQDVEINIVLDTGDCNYDFTLNSFAHGYYGDPEEGVDECSALLWLCRQQGVSKEELEHALETGDCYPKHICDLMQKRNEIFKELKDLGCVPDKPWDHYNQKGAFKTLMQAESKVMQDSISLQRHRNALADCDLTYDQFCEKWKSKNNRTPPIEELWKMRCEDVRTSVSKELPSIIDRMEQDKAHLERVLKDPDVARAAKLRDDLKVLDEDYVPFTHTNEFKKGKFLESVIDESANTSSHMNALTALVKMPLRDAIRLNEVIQAEAELNNSYTPEERKGKSSIVLDKDAVMGLYDSWNGAGGMFEIQLLEPLEVPVRFIHDANVDGSLGYGIQSIYGGLDYSESLKEIREVSPELIRKPLDQVLQEAKQISREQAEHVLETIKGICLTEALEENGLPSVSEAMAKEVVSQMGNGMLTDPIASEFRACALKDHPEWHGYTDFEMGTILFHDYCKRLDMYEEIRTQAPEL